MANAIPREELKVGQNGDFIVFTYLHGFCFKAYYKTLADVQRFHPDLKV